MLKRIGKVFIIFILSFAFLMSLSSVDAKTTKDINLKIGHSQYIVPKNKVKKYKIKSENKSIVKVTKKGKIKAKNVGETKVVVKNKKSGKKKKYNVTVKNDITSLKVYLKTGKTWVGSKYKIKIKKNPKKSKQKVYLRSENNAIAKVKGNYLIAIAKGKTKITASTKDGKVSASFWVTIYEPPRIDFIEKAPVIIENRASAQLHLAKGDYSTKNINFYSNHKDVIKVDSKGKVTALRPGNALITAKTMDGKIAQIQVISKSDNGLVTTKMLETYHAKNYKNLMIVAHPDDETLWGGANLYNDSYFVVCLTDGFRLKRANEYRDILNFTNNSGIILNYPDDQDGIRDDWTYVRAGVRKDILTLFNYKNWDKIVTYNPEGVTGHIHHRMNYQDVYDTAVSTNQTNKLYYFDRFFKKGQIPENHPRISDNDLSIKLQEIKLYKSVRDNINKFWYHMLPYENFILSNEWYQKYPEDIISAELLINAIQLPTNQIEVIGNNNNRKVEFLDQEVTINLYKDEIEPVSTIPYDLNSRIDISGLGTGYHEVPLSINSNYLLNNDVKIRINISK